MRKFSFSVAAVLFLGSSSFSNGVAHSAIVGPGDSIPQVNGDVFGWSRGDAGSTYNAWDFFEAAASPNDPSGGFIDTTPDVAGQFGAIGSITVSPGAIPVGSGNAYSPFVALNFQAIAPTGTAGSNTRIVAQFQTGGNELDYSNILLSSDTLSAGTIAPSFAMELGRTPLGGFGGEQVEYLAL